MILTSRIASRAVGWVLLALCLTTALVVQADPTRLPRVASTNLCADLPLLQIADPGQIVSVSYQSQNPRVSPVSDAARAYPVNRGSVEELLHLKPDIALVYSGWTGRRHAQLLAEQGIEVVALPYAKNWTDAIENTRAIGALIGRAETSERRIAQAERRMRALTERARSYSLLYLRPNGGTAGSQTYVDDVITRLGLHNYAAEHGYAGWRSFPLEHLVAEPPDVFLLGYFDQARSLTGSAYGLHPVFKALLERTPAISLPGSVWGCGGLELVEAAEQISEQIDRLALDQDHPP